MSKVKPLDVKYCVDTDEVTIAGTRYAGALFRELACDFPDQVGQLLRVVEKKDGLVTLERVKRG